MKRDHPAELVRLEEAGFEAEYELNLRLEKDSFFLDSGADNQMLYALNAVGTSVYLFTCASSQADTITDEQNARDGADVSKRYFTGLDCTGWVYDLFRPDEPYASRGIHPSGVGINRYRRHSDLTSDEQSFLSEQAYLSLLNLLDPNLFGFRRFRGSDPFTGRPLHWNITLRHELTSFGYTVEENLFVKEGETGLLFILHQYFNRARIYPGLEAQLVRYPLAWGESFDYLTARLLLWFQPQSSRFDALTAGLGGLASVRWNHTLADNFEAYAEVEGKTAGWVAGNVFLDPNVSLRVGLAASFF
jgi:hypothetical protein